MGRDQDEYEFTFEFGTEGTGKGQFRYVEDLAISPSGDVYVTDALNANIQVFSRKGEFRERFGDALPKGEALMKPEGIAIAPDGSVFVADSISGRIHKFSADHSWLMSFSEFGTEYGQNAESEFMQICPNGLLYMAEAGNHRVDVFGQARRIACGQGAGRVSMATMTIGDAGTRLDAGSSTDC